MALDRIARALGVQRNVVRTWLDRYRLDGLDGLQDRPRSGRPRTILQAVEAVQTIAVEPRPNHVPLHAERTGDPVQRHAIHLQQTDSPSPNQPRRGRTPTRQHLTS